MTRHPTPAEARATPYGPDPSERLSSGGARPRRPAATKKPVVGSGTGDQTAYSDWLPLSDRVFQPRSVSTASPPVGTLQVPAGQLIAKGTPDVLEGSESNAPSAPSMKT
jgi:hypothetical protein